MKVTHFLVDGHFIWQPQFHVFDHKCFLTGLSFVGFFVAFPLLPPTFCGIVQLRTSDFWQSQCEMSELGDSSGSNNEPNFVLNGKTVAEIY